MRFPLSAAIIGNTFNELKVVTPAMQEWLGHGDNQFQSVVEYNQRLSLEGAIEMTGDDSWGKEVFLYQSGWRITGTCHQQASQGKRKDGDDWKKYANQFRLNIYKDNKQVFEGMDYSTGAAHNAYIYDGKVHRCNGWSQSKQAVERGRYVTLCPTIANVLACLYSDATCVLDRTHEEFCDELGYDVDSIKDRDCYLACQKILQSMRPYLNELQPVVENY